jgi:exopolysaccharide biosynthesis predicted pyruvyltransferase EpsI
MVKTAVCQRRLKWAAAFWMKLFQTFFMEKRRMKKARKWFLEHWNISGMVRLGFALNHACVAFNEVKIIKS